MSLDQRLCHEILGTREGATFDEIKTAYRHLVKQWHPDRFPEDASMRRSCEEKVKTLNEAYRTLEGLWRAGRVAAAVESEGPTIEELLRYQPKKQTASSASPGRAPVSGGLEPARYQGKWGFVDRLGYLRIPAVYDWASAFHEGLAAVCRQEIYGYVDETGREVVPLRFGYADDFHEGRALVQYVRYGYIDRLGEWVVPPRLEAGMNFADGLAAAKQGGKWGYLNLRGEWVVFPRFDEVTPFRCGRAFGREGNSRFLVTADGSVELAV